MNFGSFDLPSDCTPAEFFSRMWPSDDSGVPGSPSYGPLHAPDEKKVQDALVLLAEDARQLCFYHQRRVSAERREAGLELIAERYYLKGREAVCDFLRQHQALVPILIQVRTKFDEYFGITEFARPRLEVFVDPEDQNSEPSIFALVPTTLPFQEAVIRLDRLDEDWWLDQPSEVRCLMNIDVEYVNAPTI